MKYLMPANTSRFLRSVKYRWIGPGFFRISILGHHFRVADARCYEIVYSTPHLAVKIGRYYIGFFIAIPIYGHE
jgi:hypothetical protein